VSRAVTPARGWRFYAAIPRHASAHSRQDFAQAWQCAASCFSHSVAQASQISAQSSRARVANGLPLAMSSEASRQIAEQSRSSRMHWRIILTSVSPRHSEAQWSQAEAHASHASIQLWNRSWVMGPSASAPCRDMQQKHCRGKRGGSSGQGSARSVHR
jgi:hypothetical protein